MNTYFEVGDERFRSREQATSQVAAWKAKKPSFVVCEVQNTEVTRKTAKGNILTEVVRGSMEHVPRIISMKNLDPTYVVVDTVENGTLGIENRPWRSERHWETRVEAEQKRAKWQAKADELAALTEADIKEVHVPTLADILERDAGEIACLQTKITDTREELEKAKKQANASIASEVATLKNQIAALEAKTGQDCRPQQEKFDAAVKAYHKAIHYDQLEEKAQERVYENHRDDCWPNSACRVAGECTYEPGDDEIEEYLLENAEKFEVEDEEIAIEQITVQVQITSDAEKLWSCAEMQRKYSQHVGTLPPEAGKSISIYARSLGPSTFCNSRRTWRVADTMGVDVGKPGEAVLYVLCDHQIDHEAEALCSEHKFRTAERNAA